MDDDQDLQRQIDALKESVVGNRADIDALITGAAASVERADRSEARGDAHDLRIGDLEKRVDVDEKMIAVLRAEGVLHRELTEQMYEALRSSRKIGAAMGIVMAERKVSEDDAFTILTTASQNTNRKVRDLAKEIVATGNVSELPEL